MFRGDLASLQALSQVETKGKVIHGSPLYLGYQQIFLRSEYMTLPIDNTTDFQDVIYC